MEQPFDFYLDFPSRVSGSPSEHLEVILAIIREVYKKKWEDVMAKNLRELSYIMKLLYHQKEKNLQNDRSISLKNGQSTYFKLFLALKDEAK